MDQPTDTCQEASDLDLEGLKRLNEETIKTLMNDIHLLKWKVSQLEPRTVPGKYHRLLLKRRQLNQQTIDTAEEDLKDEIQHYKNRIKETASLTGVTIEKRNKKVVFLDGDVCRAEYELDLTVHDRPVRLSCRTETEPPASIRDTDPPEKVTWLSINGPQDVHGEEITEAVDRLASHAAFSLLKSHIVWRRDMQEVVKTLLDTYADNVTCFKSRADQLCLKINHSQSGRPEFIVEFGKTKDGCRIVPDVKLKMDAPKSWKTKDKKNVIGSAPEMFKLSTKTYGLEKALTDLVQLVTTDG